MKPILCNENANIYIPDAECSDCEEVKKELDALREEYEEFASEMDACCEEVKDRLTTAEEEIDTKQDILTAGTGIKIENGVISATGGGADVTEEAILSALGYEKIVMAMTDDDGNTASWEFIAKRIGD